MTAGYDVVVMGGGPAGLAVAGVLARQSRSVVVCERNDYRAARVGETFGGEILPLLEAIGAGDTMRELVGRELPFLSIRSAWGTDELVERDSMLHPLGAGLHVDRARFDERLAAWARSAGVTVHAGMGRCSVARVDDRFVVSSSAMSVRGRVLVDASGRGAPACASIDRRRWLAVDRQVAIVARLAFARPETDTALLLEAVEDGWWYSVPQPDGALVIAFVTDADLAPAGARAQLPERFAAALARARHTSARTRDAAITGALRVVRADSGVLLPAGGRGWRAIGDAAMATDPLAGNGVPRALRSALGAVADIHRILDGDADERAPDLLPAFTDYLDRRATFHLAETRWPAAPFWARRRPVAWRQLPITLGPEVPLRVAGEPRPEALWPAEALLPSRALRPVLASLSSPRPAHAVLSQLRELAPLGDRRLLVGVQLLVEHGVLARA